MPEIIARVKHQNQERAKTCRTFFLEILSPLLLHLVVDDVESKNANGVDFFLEATRAKPELFMELEFGFFVAPVVVARSNSGEDMTEGINVPRFL